MDAFLAVMHPLVERLRRAGRRPSSTLLGVTRHTGKGESFGELHERAKKLGIEGRSRMDKKELARAIARKQ